MTGEISHSWIKQLAWGRSFAVRQDLAKAYGDAMSVLQDPNISPETLKQVFRHYFSWCIHLGLADENTGRAAMNYVLEHGSAELAWSALFRLNCQAIRYAACQLPCTENCCCRCPEAPDDILCNGVLAEAAFNAIRTAQPGHKGN